MNTTEKNLRDDLQNMRDGMRKVFGDLGCEYCAAGVDHPTADADGEDTMDGGEMRESAITIDFDPEHTAQNRQAREMGKRARSRNNLREARRTPLVIAFGSRDQDS